MRKHPRSYAPEFRQKIIELARPGRGFDELAREFSLAPQTVRNWCKQDKLDARSRTDGLTSEERLEVSKLRREVKRLTIENEILSKAAGVVCSGNQLDPRQAFEFVKPYHAEYSVTTLCRVLDVTEPLLCVAASRAALNVEAHYASRDRSDRAGQSGLLYDSDRSREGWNVNNKRARRIYREEKLSIVGSRVVAYEAVTNGPAED
jgi:transposase